MIFAITEMICFEVFAFDILSIISPGFKLIFKTFQKVVCIGIVLLELVRRVFLREPSAEAEGSRFLAFTNRWI